jgi:REP element-mobilizing transposase RayT
MPEFSKTVSFWRGALPHWEVVDGRYFVTVRLAGSLPRTAEEELHAQLAGVSESDYLARSRVYFQRLETLLDQCQMQKDSLAVPEVARQIETTVRTYEGLGYWRMLAYTIMPNHLHLFFRCGSMGLKGVMERFKRTTARFIKLNVPSVQKPLWQSEWFDHWSRSVQEDDKIVSYIRNNPVRAGLVSDPNEWVWTRGEV